MAFVLVSRLEFYDPQLPILEFFFHLLFIEMFLDFLYI